ncbi:MAG TPA: glycosyltransferase family 87 protein, partial [Rhodoblastus sp.]|nr:glycosyltransferase family 87 protein [Rhodoblastus sp.]
MTSTLLSRLRDADWLDASRARAYPRIVAGVVLLALLGLVLTAHGAVDSRGEPIGTDFSNFWSASKLALMGDPAGVYDMARQYAVQKQEFGPQTGFYPFFYPPIYLLICYPLAALPYLTALAIWIATTAYAYQAVVRRIGQGVVGLVPVLAFPAVFVTVGHGQNALLTTALLGAAALCLDRRPIVAGVLLGLLAFKPHLAVVAPLMLLAAGRWRAFFASAVMACALALVSLGAFGLDAWKAFIASAPAAKAVLDDKMMDVEKLQSVFGAVRLLGGGADLAYLAQGVVALGVVGVLLFLARRSLTGEAIGALVATAAALTSPYFLDYDLALLAIPLAWATAQGVKTGFLPWEKSILV